MECVIHKINGNLDFYSLKKIHVANMISII